MKNKIKMFLLILIGILAVHANIAMASVTTSHDTESDATTVNKVKKAEAVSDESQNRVIRNAFNQVDIENDFVNFSVQTDIRKSGVRQSGNEEVIGLIYDENTGANIANASIEFVELDLVVKSDLDGRLSLSGLPVGEYNVKVSADGYYTATFTLPVSSAGGTNIYSLPLSKYYDASEIVNENILDTGKEEAQSIYFFEEKENTSTRYSTPTLSKITVLYNGQIYEFGSNINDYLYYVVAHEMLTPEDGLYANMTNAQKLEGFKAQAVVSRTYATTRASYGQKHLTNGYNFCSTTCCQYYGPWYTNSLAVQAVDATTNQIVYDTIKNRICDTFFFASCKGQTKSYKEVYGGGNTNVSYLVSVACPYDLRMSTESGHGVGMCQDGAMGYAKQNYDYVSILTHYYTGTSVITANPCVADGIVTGETKRVTLTANVAKEFLVYVNSSAIYLFDVQQAGNTSCTPTLQICNSSGAVLDSRSSYGRISLTLSPGEYKVVVSSSVSADVQVGVNCNQNVPALSVNLTDTGNQWKSHDYYINGVTKKVYKFTPSATDTYIFETAYFKQLSDTVLVVQNNVGTALGRSDDWGGSNYSRVSVDLTANTTYYVIVGGYGFDNSNSASTKNINCKLHVSMN